MHAWWIAENKRIKFASTEYILGMTSAYFSSIFRFIEQIPEERAFFLELVREESPLLYIYFTSTLYINNHLATLHFSSFTCEIADFIVIKKRSDREIIFCQQA